MNSIVSQATGAAQMSATAQLSSASLLREESPGLPSRRVRLGPGRAIPHGWLLGPVALIVLWSLASATGLMDPRTFPSPWSVVVTAGNLIASGRLQSNLLTSAGRVAQGLAWGTLAGLILAIVAGMSRIGGYLIDGPVQIKRAIPTLALIPLLMLWFGIGEGMKVTIIALSAFVPVYVNTYDGLRTIDRRYVELSESLRVSRWQFVRHVIVPGALPHFFLGLRFGVTYAWLALVVVEQVNATSGIGYMIDLAGTYGQTDVIVVGLVVYGLLGIASDGLVRLVQGRVLTWRRTLGD